MIRRQRYKISIKREQKNAFSLPSVRNLSNFFRKLDAILALNMHKADGDVLYYVYSPAIEYIFDSVRDIKANLTTHLFLGSRFIRHVTLSITYRRRTLR